MGYQLPNGSKLQLSNTTGAEKAFTAISNAVEGVLTVTANTGGTAVAAGDVILITSSTSSQLNGALLYVKAASDTSVTLLGEDTSSTADYPATTSGKFVKVSGWIDLPLVTDIAASGGDAQTTTINPIQLDRGIDLFTGLAASSSTLTFTHDSTDAVRAPLQAVTRTQKVCGYRIINPKALNGVGEHRLVSVTAAFNPIPQMASGEVETVTLALSYKSDMRFYSTANVPNAAV